MVGRVRATRFTVTDQGSGEVVYEEVDAKPRAEERSNVTCTETWQEGGLLVEFAVTGVLR